MSIETTFVYRDDVSGRIGTPDEPVETRRITVDVEMELAADTYNRVMNQLQVLLAKARPAAAKPRGYIRNGPARHRDTEARRLHRLVKQWAQAHGEPVAARGRPTKDQVDRYMAAQPQPV